MKIVSVDGFPSGTFSSLSFCFSSRSLFGSSLLAVAWFFSFCSSFFCFSAKYASFLALNCSILAAFSSSVGGGTAFLMKMVLLWNFLPLNCSIALSASSFVLNCANANPKCLVIGLAGFFVMTLLGISTSTLNC